MRTDEKSPLKGHWPVAFALGGAVEDPALVPLNHTMNVLAGDEYRVPVGLPADTEAAKCIAGLLDERGWARISPAVGIGPVAAILSIPTFADRPLIVADDAAIALASLSPVPRVCVTLSQIQDAARQEVPDRDPGAKAPSTSGRAIDQARDLGFAVYWAIGDGLTPARRRKTMVAAGWPEGVLAWIAQPSAASVPT